jgi:hypothetical protein
MALYSCRRELCTDRSATANYHGCNRPLLIWIKYWANARVKEPWWCQMGVGNSCHNHSLLCRAKSSWRRLNTSTARTKYSTVLLSASVVGWPLVLNSAMSWRPSER